MTITFPRLRSRAPRHKAIDEVARLRHQLDGAELHMKGLRVQVMDAEDARDELKVKATRCEEAEARATAAELALSQQTSELMALRAFRDNQLSVSDLSAKTHAPAAPLPTAKRFTAGRVVQAAASPHAAHLPQPAADNEATQEIPKVKPERQVA